MKVYVFNLKQVHKLVSLILTVAISVGITVGALILVDNAVVAAFSDSAVDNSKTIIIDAGHGGEDSGAVGSNGALEKDLNLEISKLVKEELEKSGYTVIMTRTEDRMLYSEDENIKGMRKLSDLKNRVKIAEEYPGATLISIHMNSFGASKYSGLQVYYKNDDEDSRKLAESIQTSVRQTLQAENDRKVKAGDCIYLLENSPINTVLVECGFLTNSEECEKLTEKEYQKQLSFSIVCGIIEYIESKTA